MKYLSLLFLFFIGCSSQKTERQTLHDFPIFEGMDCPEQFSVDNESQLRTQAESLNMRYVDYLHYINKKKADRTLALGK